MAKKRFIHPPYGKRWHSLFCLPLQAYPTGRLHSYNARLFYFLPNPQPKFVYFLKDEIVKQELEGEEERTRALLSLSQREKQRNPVCRRKSSNIKLKQKCRPPLPGRPAKLALLCASAQRKTAGQAEK